MKIRKYNLVKDRKIIQEYLANLENNGRISFFHSKIQLDLLSRYKSLFLALDGEKILNIFYKDDKKSNVRFLFEHPKKNYEFMDDYDLICVAILSNSERKDFALSESILDTSVISLLAGGELRNVRKKVNHFKKEFAGFEAINFDKKDYTKRELLSFFSEWEKVSKSREKDSPDAFLDRNLVNYIFSEDSEKVEGIILRYKGKIIGVCFYFISPMRRTAIEFCSKALTDYTGCSEFLKWAVCERVSENGIKSLNMGASRDDKVLNFKSKFGGHKEDFYYVPIKNKTNNVDWAFWVGDQYFK